MMWSLSVVGPKFVARDWSAFRARRIVSILLGSVILLLASWFTAPARAAGFAPAAPLATARDSHTSTLLPSGKVLVAGGQNYGSGILASAELYDPATNSWSAAGTLATAHENHTATLLLSGKVLVVGGAGTSVVSVELYDPARNSWSAAGRLATARDSHTATLLPSGKVLVAGGYNSASGALASAELYDPATNSWTAAGTLATARDYHTATLLPSGKVLVAGGVGEGASGVVASAELYDPATNSWSEAGTLATAREVHTATLLPSGKVLAVGGLNGSGYLGSAELYDPTTNSWSAAGSLATTRYLHSASLMPSGKVLVVGGGDSALATAELYDPASNSWNAAGALATARGYHSATLLPSGRLLLAGGRNSSGDLASAELYDPTTTAWAAAASMATARELHTATLLPSGKVLVAGGFGNSNSVLSSAELYDPTTDTWAAAAPLAAARYGHTATLLPSGKVLVAGGYNGSYLASAELYDPATNTWSPAGPMATARNGHTATLLPSGKVLVAGGYYLSSLVSAELYDPATNTWSMVGSMATARSGHTATLLPSGKVLVAGGDSNSGIGLLSSAELYDPATKTWSMAGSMATARSLHTATLLPSGKLLIAGGYNLASAELYDPRTNTWSAAGSMATARQQHTAILLPSGMVVVAGGIFFIGPTGYPLCLSNAELYDPTTNAWAAAAPLGAARCNHTATLLISGKAVAAGGTGTSSIIASAELFDPGLAPVAALQPNLSATSAFLLQTSALVATGSGFAPPLEGSGGASNNSATNMPVFQVQRIDNAQMRFIPNDESVNLSDTGFVGSATALAGFPAGPILVRVWVNGVPSAARYTVVKPQGYVPLNPTRLMDTRPGFTTTDGISAGEGALAVGETRTLKVTNRGGIPNTTISAVAVNLVAVAPTGFGYITVWSGDGAIPFAGNLNLNPGLTLPNLVVSQVSASGEVSIYNGSSTAVDIVVNLEGYFPAETSYVPMSALRLLDTRSGSTTVDHQFEANGAVPSGAELDLTIAGRAGLPPTGVGAVLLNMTVFNPTNFGFVTVWPYGTPLPMAGNLDLNPGHTITNLVISKVGSDGKVAILNGGLDGTQLIANVQGWFPASSGYAGLTPARILDTRPGYTTIDHQNEGGGALASGGQIYLTVTNRGGVPQAGVGAVVLKITAINPGDVGFLTVWPTGVAQPTIGNLNLNPGYTLSNVVIAKVGSNGQVSIYCGSAAPTNVVIDVQGWFPESP